MKKELWRRYKGTTAEELCAAIRELWLAKFPEYVRLLNEIPNKLIEQEATGLGPRGIKEFQFMDGSKPTPDWIETFLKKWQNGYGRRRLKELEKFLSTPPYADHLCDDEASALEDEIYWMDPDAPLNEFIEADKKKDALIKKYSLK